MFIGLLRGFQEEAHDRIVDRHKMLLALPMGTGKAVTLRSPVLTVHGWTPAGAIREGDLLIGRDGHPTKVLGVYPQPEQQLYEVTFTDGASVIVDGPHLWSVQTPDETHAYPDNWRTMSTLDLKDDLYSANGNRRWRIPMLSGPVQYHPVGDLPLDPYTLGVVLGDGWIPKVGRACITTDREVLMAVGASAIRPRPGCYSGSVAVPDELGLAGHRAWEKFIPEQYLRAAPEERLSLLQGLLDTDGSSDRRQHGVEFSSTSEALIDGVVDLVQGLGGIARNKTSRVATYTHNGEKREGRLSWRLNVKLPPHFLPFRLARKRDAYIAPTKYPPVRPIKSIEPAMVGEGVCFTVDAEDSLYVIKDHVVTHNTVTALAAVESMMEDEIITEPGIILAGSSIKYQWEKEIAKFTDSKAVVVTGTPTQREKIYTDFYNWRQTGIDYLIVTYDSMSNDRKIFRHLPKGFVIADEVTALKGHRSKRSQRAKSLFATTPVKIGLSGTPIENGKPEELYSIMEFIDPSVLGRFDLFDRAFIVRNSSGWVDGYKNLGTLHNKMKPAMVRRSFDDPEISAALPAEIVKEPFLVDLDSKTRSVMKRITKDLKDDLTALVNSPGSSSFDLMAHYGQGGTAKEFDQSDVLRGMVMSKITVSRMLCDHPQLVRDSADHYDRGDGLKGSAYASYLKAEGLLDIKSTAKLDAVEEVVNEALADPKTKVVIFSTFVGMLDLIAARFTEKSVTYHGGMSAQGRQARKEQFQTDPKTRLFISSDAGGYGVDLPQANVLINYDLPWQAGALDQRNARPRRVSSTWEYIVIEQAMVRDSLEEWQYQMLAHKTAVSQAILAGRGITATGDVSVPLGSLLSHLQK